MSLINEALKRAKDDASTTPAGGPPLIPVYTRPADTPATRFPRDGIVMVGIPLLFVALIGGALAFYFIHVKRLVKPLPRPAAAAETARSPQAQNATVVRESSSPRPGAGGQANPPGPAQSVPNRNDTPAGGSPLGQAAGAAAAGNLIQAPVTNFGKAWRKGEAVAREVAAFEGQLDTPEKPATAPPPAQPNVPTPAAPPATAAAARPHGSSPAATTLRNKLRLSGIVVAPTGRMALINNQVLKCGEQLEGATIIAIEADHVTLQLGDEKVELRVAGLP